MKVAVVWNHASRLIDCSFRFEQYLRGFRTLGHDPVLVCHSGCDEGFPEPAQCYPATTFEDAELWREIGAEVAVIVTWHRMPAVLAALQRAGTRVVSISDSDGQVGVHAHPRRTFEQLWLTHSGWKEKARCTKYWLEKYLWRGRDENQMYLESTRYSDVLVLGSREGRRHFLRFLRQQGEERLDEKVTVAPFNIGAAFLSCPLPEAKDDRIVAIGRWGDPQKHPGLLAAASEILLRERPQTELVIFGAGGDPWFSQLTEREPRLDYRGVADQVEVARTLAGCRSIVFSSRWEGSPHAANEALATGATLVGTPIPSLVSWSGDGRFGRVAAQAKPRLLADAMIAEMDEWDNGRRDHLAIAAVWRERLAPQNVCRVLLEALDERPK